MGNVSIGTQIVYKLHTFGLGKLKLELLILGFTDRQTKVKLNAPSASAGT